MSVLRFFRTRAFQPLWASLHRISLIGMNYWASELPFTGELDALRWLAARLEDVPEPVIFDIGANVGAYSDAVLKAFSGSCRIHAFEPSRAAFEKAGERLKGETHVQLNQLAVSDREGEAVLRTSEPGASIASLEPLRQPVRAFVEQLNETVRTTTIDAYCERAAIGEIHLLKMDIEGHELAAVRGARRMLDERKIRYVQFEFGENNVSARTYLRDFVSSLHGFRFYRIVPGGPVPWEYSGGRSEIFATMNYLVERT
jgi:FkbM family methyltransferase